MGGEGIKRERDRAARLGAYAFVGQKTATSRRAASLGAYAFVGQKAATSRFPAVARSRSLA